MGGCKWKEGWEGGKKLGCKWEEGWGEEGSWDDAWYANGRRYRWRDGWRDERKNGRRKGRRKRRRKGRKLEEKRRRALEDQRGGSR
jgi:hypothetical protein